MVRPRELLKRMLPPAVRDLAVAARQKLAPPPLETIALHRYQVAAEPDEAPRLTLVIPSIAPKSAFGGVITGLDIFLRIGASTGADMRLLIDDFGAVDTSVLHARARACGVDPARIEVVARTEAVPRVSVRREESFVAFNWWTAINIRSVLAQQEALFGRKFPLVYLIQEYEAGLYPFSSTHMIARSAYDPAWPCWAVINSGELDAYLQLLGHGFARKYLFEPQIADSLRPFLEGPAAIKQPRILIYGRPSIPRNCYPNVEAGLRRWVEIFPQARDWEVVSAGLPHPAVELGGGVVLRSLGKLALEDYGELLRTTATGLSLMASPHPSYPPLEMAHFGVRTVTNTYSCKDLSTSHENIISIQDTSADTIAEALAQACQAFAVDPEGVWRARALRPSFLASSAFAFIDQLAHDLRTGWQAASIEQQGERSSASSGARG